MTRVSGFIRNQGQLILQNERYALLHAIILALLPYTTWLSVAVVALVTLRKGWGASNRLLGVAMLAQFTVLLISMSAGIALMNTLLTFVPCFLAACALRWAANWRAVAGIFFFQAMIAVLLLQVCMPDFIMQQYLFIQAALQEIQGNNALLTLINEKTSLNPMIFASYLLGLQVVGVVFSACISLMFARSIQSQLFHPGGFRQEMLAFRGEKIGLCLLVILFIAARQENVIAMSLLPIFMLYFLLAGFSLSYQVISKKRPLSSLIFLIVALVLMPFIMLPVYVIFGSLDSLFNLRLYLPSDAGKTT
jgi:hypothetical protein